MARRIFTRLGEAEAKVHGTTIEKVHFHEVGAVDSIADIVGTAIGWDLLGVERHRCLADADGHGFITIAHGRCSIPAPATAELLQGIPLAASTSEAELTTPTGAAIVATLAEQFRPAAGDEDRADWLRRRQPRPGGAAELLRLLVGEAAEPEPSAGDQMWMLETNLDDATGEVIGHCTARLLEAGALDVYTTAIQMKKNRPGVLLTVLCKPADADRLDAMILFQRNADARRAPLPSSAAASSTAAGMKWQRRSARSTACWPDRPAARRGSRPNTKPAAAWPPSETCRCVR